jgi:hypothetical protein
MSWAVAERCGHAYAKLQPQLQLWQLLQWWQLLCQYSSCAVQCCNLVASFGHVVPVQ